MEFFSIGHDDPLSVVDDWGPEDSDPLSLSTMPLSRLSRLGFLFGGVGDARHIYGSIIGLHRASQRLSKDRQSVVHAHFTLLDIHPTVLARDLCILLLLEQLIKGDIDEDAKVEIKAAVFYTFIGIVVPLYCHRRFHDTVKSAITNLQQNPPLLPPWLHVVDESMPAILSALKHWDTALTHKTVRGILEHHQKDETADMVDEVISSPSAQESQRSKIAWTLLDLVPPRPLSGSWRDHSVRSKIPFLSLSLFDIDADIPSLHPLFPPCLTLTTPHREKRLPLGQW